MERDIDFEQLAAAEGGDPVARWLARGASDGRRHWPPSDTEVPALAEQIHHETIYPQRQHGAGELHAALAQMLAANGVETLSINDVQTAVTSLAANCAAEMAAEVPTARATILQARRGAREACEHLTAFQKEHESELKGRPPLPEPGKWKRRFGSKGHVVFVLLIFVLEAGGFLLLGHDYWREAAVFGAFGGAISGFFLWALHHVLCDGQTRFALRRHRVWLIATLIAATHMVFAYVMACIRDGLHDINHLSVVSGIGSLLVAPSALSPESVLVVVLAAVLLLATWLTSVGRGKFPLEDDYRRLWACKEAAEAAVDEAKRRPFAEVTRIVGNSEERFKALQSTREEGLRRCRAHFAGADRARRQYLVTMDQARRTATRYWEAYAKANRENRAAGNPPPRALNAPLPIAATFDFDRDLLAGFNSQMQHALELAGHSQQATTQAQRVLSIYTADLLAHLERVVEDPGLVEPPPSFEIVLRQADGAAFKSAKDLPAGGNEFVRGFLGLGK